jgi:hypothetical protein
MTVTYKILIVLIVLLSLLIAAPAAPAISSAEAAAKSRLNTAYKIVRTEQIGIKGFLFPSPRRQVKAFKYEPGLKAAVVKNVRRAVLRRKGQTVYIIRSATDRKRMTFVTFTPRGRGWLLKAKASGGYNLRKVNFKLDPVIYQGS